MQDAVHEHTVASSEPVATASPLG